ncbi:MAG TPA: glycosyltransferase family 39 protein [Vicinamibacterales bacterium]|nr:glycosyltransferase family 39 protein [Vicinamibacterales bacterium]
MSTAIAAVTAIALAVFGIATGTWAVGGSDSSCYALMAQAFASGHLQPSSSLAIEAPWPDAPRTLAPGGFIPSPVRSDSASPICAPGMSVLMAPLAALFGRDAIFWLVPLSGALLVWSAFVIARRLAGGMAGATAAVLTATSPIVLFQVVQPMNDVLAAALWMAAFAFTARSAEARSAKADPGILTGLLIGLAILVRPNLAPLAFVIAFAPWILNWPKPTRSIALSAAGALPGVIVMLWLNQQLYGSVVASGYGDASQLFSVGHINQNLSNFGRALLDTQYLVPLLGLAAPFVFTGSERRISIVVLLGVVVVCVIYFLYQPYPEWWYLRFLIPALVLMLILASAAGVRLASRARMGGVVPIAAVLLAILGTRAAGQRQVFELQRLEGRYRDSAALAAERLPDNAIVITVWQSGSMRFHADRQAVMWDSLDPAWLDRAVTWLQQRGHQPYFLFERREEPEFRTRFRGHSMYGALDWPPRVDLNREVRIYDPGDRARFLAGERYPTDNQPRRK